MRVEKVNIKYRFDLWYLVKFVCKDLVVVFKKCECGDLLLWIVFVVNYLWWCVVIFDGD